MKFTATQIAGILEGEIEGNPEITVHKLSKIEEGEQGSLTFLANPKYTAYIYTTEASITIVNKDFIQRVSKGRTGYLVLTNEEVIPISKSKRHVFDRLLEFLL